jgi:hypothetical protein
VESTCNVTLPNAAHAHVDIAKLRDYCLSSSHPEGRHKARVFLSALDLSAQDAEFLRRAILDAVVFTDAVPADTDPFGSRHVVDFELKRGNRKAMIRTAWIIRRGETIPRMLTCYVL